MSDNLDNETRSAPVYPSRRVAVLSMLPESAKQRALDLALQHKLDSDDPFWSMIHAIAMVEYNDRLLNDATERFTGIVENLSVFAEHLPGLVTLSGKTATETIERAGAKAGETAGDEVKKAADSVGQQVVSVVNGALAEHSKNFAGPMTKAANKIADMLTNRRDELVGNFSGMLDSTYQTAVNNHESDMNRVTRQILDNFVIDQIRAQKWSGRIQILMLIVTWIIAAFIGGAIMVDAYLNPVVQTIANYMRLL